VVGGAVPHNFHKALDHLVKGKKMHGKVARFLIERLLFTPVYLLLRLYLTAIFEVNALSSPIEPFFLLVFSFSGKVSPGGCEKCDSKFSITASLKLVRTLHFPVLQPQLRRPDGISNPLKCPF